MTSIHVAGNLTISSGRLVSSLVDFKPHPEWRHCNLSSSVLSLTNRSKTIQMSYGLCKPQKINKAEMHQHFSGRNGETDYAGNKKKGWISKTDVHEKTICKQNFAVPYGRHTILTRTFFQSRELPMLTGTVFLSHELPVLTHMVFPSHELPVLTCTVFLNRELPACGGTAYWLTWSSFHTRRTKREA